GRAFYSSRMLPPRGSAWSRAPILVGWALGLACFVYLMALAPTLNTADESFTSTGRSACTRARLSIATSSTSSARGVLSLRAGVRDRRRLDHECSHGHLAPACAERGVHVLPRARRRVDGRGDSRRPPGGRHLRPGVEHGEPPLDRDSPAIRRRVPLSLAVMGGGPRSASLHGSWGGPRATLRTSGARPAERMREPVIYAAFVPRAGRGSTSRPL